MENPNNESRIEYRYQKFLLRDILHLSSEEIEKMDLMEYNHALNYCALTYIGRSFLGGSDTGDKPNQPKKTPLDFQIKHPQIEQYIKDKNKENPYIGGKKYG